jgi:cobalt-zinc-cadmium efflux system membrane fusion protein
MNENINWRPFVFGGSVILALIVGFVIARQMYSVSQAPEATTSIPAAEPGELKLDASYLEFAGIKTEAVTTGNLSVDILASATVEAAPNGEAVVTAHATGTIAANSA